MCFVFFFFPLDYAAACDLHILGNCACIFLSICSLFDLGTERLKGDASLTEILKLFMGALHVLCYVLKSFTVDFFPNVFHGLLQDNMPQEKAPLASGARPHMFCTPKGNEVVQWLLWE